MPVGQIEFLLDNPSARMDIQSFDLPVIGTVELFQPGDRAKLDHYLGLAPHSPNEVLADGEAFNPDSSGFKAFANTDDARQDAAARRADDGPTDDRPQRATVRAVRTEGSCSAT